MPTTESGYDYFEVLSGLQKDIRRGKAARALYWANELESFNEEKGTGVTVLWNSLKTIASEDISIANPMLPLLIDTLEKSYCHFKAKKGDKKHRLFLAHAILALCRSEKSRIANHLVILVYGGKKFSLGGKPSIPDYALDMHTARGKAMGIGMKHFLEEGAKLGNETQKFKDKYKEKAEEILLQHGEP